MENRRMRRARARRAYDKLSKTWRAVRRNQDALVKIGMFDPKEVVVGRKPPLSLFLQMTATVDPISVVDRPGPGTEVVREILDYSRSQELTWKGRDVRVQTRRGVETIPMAGDDD